MIDLLLQHKGEEEIPLFQGKVHSNTGKKKERKKVHNTRKTTPVYIWLQQKTLWSAPQTFAKKKI